VAEDFTHAPLGFHPSLLGFHRGSAAISLAKPFGEALIEHVVRQFIIYILTNSFFCCIMFSQKQNCAQMYNFNTILKQRYGIAKSDLRYRIDHKAAINAAITPERTKHYAYKKPLQQLT
jgi:hypothetical protein